MTSKNNRKRKTSAKERIKQGFPISLNISLALMVFFVIYNQLRHQPPSSSNQLQLKSKVTKNKSNQLGSFYDVKYKSNYDGDTVRFASIGEGDSIFYQNVSVRLRGVDTPEMKTKDKCEKTVAKRAQRVVEKILRGAESIELRNCSKGKYFRLVCDIIVYRSQKTLSLRKVLEGEHLAYPYDGGTKQKINWCTYPKRQ